MPINPTYDKHGHFYATVVALSEEVHETIVPNGETWSVVHFIASGAYLDDTSVALYWDRGGAGEVLLAASHGDARIPIFETVTGDGSKKLSIVLVNDTSASRIMGGRWDAEIE
jgi:hypothetical protein